MTSDDILKRVNEYYTGRLREHGAVARGVDWNSEESQILRFDQLLKVCPASGSFVVGDYGCGYGAMLDHVAARYPEARFRGFDIADAMIETARRNHPHVDPAIFSTDEAVLADCEYVVASGVFNVKLQTPIDAWKEYVTRTIERLAACSSRGFSFNMLTSYSDADKMRPDLYYGDPCEWFDHCTRRYSRHVALLHDYGLWEFTILVRR